MKPLVDLPDPERVAVNIAAGLATTVSTDFPAETLQGLATHAQVELEAGDADEYPITERAQVRVTLHAAPGRRTAVKKAASDAMARFYSWPGNAEAAGCTIPGGRSAVVTDPDTGNVMCWFLVRIALKASLAS